MKTLTKFALCLIGASALIVSAAAQDVVNTVIGGGPNGLPGKNANMNQPYEVAVDSGGNVYVASSALFRVFKISPAGTETVVAGNGIQGYSGDGGLAVKASLYQPWGLAIDNASPPNVYVADFGECLVRKISQSTGVITTVAGLVNSSGTGGSCGYGGDGGQAKAAELSGPAGLAVNPLTNDLYIAEYYNGDVRKVAGGVPTGIITTVAGTSQQNCQGSAPYGDGGPATSAHFCYPDAVSLDTASPVNLYVSEDNRCTIREVVGSSKNIYQLAGSYTACGYNGDGINAVGAELYEPWQTHISISGSTTTVQVADYDNARIRQFSLTYSAGVPKPGTISTIAGKGSYGWCNDDNGSALSACMGPVGLAYDSAGNFYIGDYGAYRVRKVTKSTGFINTIMGWGEGTTNIYQYSDPVGISGVGGTPSLLYPVGVYADPTSTKVYVGGYQGEAVYLWDSAKNTITGFAGNGIYGFAGDGSPAGSAAAQLAYPLGIAKDSKGNIYIADSNNCAIREVVAATGIITTIAGGSPGALKGCGYVNSGPTNSQFSSPQAVAVDAANNIYVADYNNCAIRKIPASGGTVSTIAGTGPPSGSCGYTGDGGPAVSAKIYYPVSIALDGAGNIYFSEWNSACRIREIVAQTGIIQTVVGDGSCGYSGDGSAIGNSIYNTYSTVDPNGNIFLSDYYEDILRWVTPSGQMVTFAGTQGSNGFAGDGSPAMSAKFYEPSGIARDSAGNTYVADEQNLRVRQITPFAGYGLSAGNLLFETQAAGTVSDFQPITVSAIGPTTISSITITAGFSEIDDCVGQPLTATQTCEIDVYFQPSAAGKVLGSITIGSNAFLAGNPNKITLSGTASGLALTGKTAFGNVPLKSPTANTLTLTNSGAAAVTLGKIYLTSTTGFSITGGTCPTTGGSLASKASCTIIATLNPQTLGAFKSTLVVPSNDPATPLLTLLTGTGTPDVSVPSTLGFGDVTHGTAKVLDLTVSNVGTTVSLTVSTTITGSGAAAFTVLSTGNTCGTAVAPGKTCTLPVQFEDATTGSYTATLTVTTNGGANPAVSLSGTAD